MNKECIAVGRSKSEDAKSASQLKPEPSSGAKSLNRRRSVKVFSVEPSQDLWALGMIIWEVLHGSIPFPKITFTTLLIRHITDGGRPEIDPDIPPEIQQLLQDLWSLDVYKRPTAAVVVNVLEDMYLRLAPAIPGGHQHGCSTFTNDDDNLSVRGSVGSLNQSLNGASNFRLSSGRNNASDNVPTAATEAAAFLDAEPDEGKTRHKGRDRKSNGGSLESAPEDTSTTLTSKGSGLLDVVVNPMCSVDYGSTPTSPPATNLPRLSVSSSRPSNAMDDFDNPTFLGIPGRTASGRKDHRLSDRPVVTFDDSAMIHNHGKDTISFRADTL